MSVHIIFLLIVYLSNSQVPPSWGGNPVYTVRVKMLNNNPITTWNFTYYYDWNLKAERYEHDAPQQDEMCLLPSTLFTKNKLPCIATFAKDGWSYIEYPTKNFCCKCTRNFGAIKYDWLKENSTYIGIETVNEVSVTHWTKQGLYLNHYYSTVDRALPVKFFEIKQGNPKSWDFDLKTYNTAPIDPSKFSAVCNTRCLGTCEVLQSQFQKLVMQ